MQIRTSTSSQACFPLVVANVARRLRESQQAVQIAERELAWCGQTHLDVLIGSNLVSHVIKMSGWLWLPTQVVGGVDGFLVRFVSLLFNPPINILHVILLWIQMHVR